MPRRLIRAIFGNIKTTFPDWTMPIEEVAASGANIVVRCRFRGTHRGVGRLPVDGGLMIGAPATGRTMDVQHIHWYSFENGLIVQHWANRENIGMMRQLRLLPTTDFNFGKLAAPPPA